MSLHGISAFPPFSTHKDISPKNQHRRIHGHHIGVKDIKIFDVIKEIIPKEDKEKNDGFHHYLCRLTFNDYVTDNCYLTDHKISELYMNSSFKGMLIGVPVGHGWFDPTDKFTERGNLPKSFYASDEVWVQEFYKAAKSKNQNNPSSPIINTIPNNIKKNCDLQNDDTKDNSDSDLPDLVEIII